jgi:hypothetical protein
MTGVGERWVRFLRLYGPYAEERKHARGLNKGEARHHLAAYRQQFTADCMAIPARTAEYLNSRAGGGNVRRRQLMPAREKLAAF